MTGSAKINHVSAKHCHFFHHCSIITYELYILKISITTAEFNGFSSETYRNEISHSELKILAKIQLGVVCAHTVDFTGPVIYCLSSL